MRSPLETQQLLIRCCSSWWYCGLTTGLHLAAISGLSLSGLPIYWVFAGSCVLLASWCSNLWSEGLRRTAGAIVELQLTDIGWQLGLRSGERLAVDLLPEVVLLPWLVVLRFKSCELMPRRLAVALFPDSVAGQGLRHLRALLRVYSPQS
jgi:hypothetical protein